MARLLQVPNHFVTNWSLSHRAPDRGTNKRRDTIASPLPTESLDMLLVGRQHPPPAPLCQRKLSEGYQAPQDYMLAHQSLLRMLSAAAAQQKKSTSPSVNLPALAVTPPPQTAFRQSLSSTGVSDPADYIKRETHSVIICNATVYTHSELSISSACGIHQHLPITWHFYQGPAYPMGG